MSGGGKKSLICEELYFEGEPKILIKIQDFLNNTDGKNVQSQRRRWKHWNMCKNHCAKELSETYASAQAL